ncbi:SBBP repeat-containing protein [Mechercharimyces sp. CAU 1602]|uniref:SBBP repeat-containing protein n=1 Tax=Mechercharimyces sp. CAU 1602 TaxID=2973933 RepID=UPI002867B151|nr:SBBP repeat-containing protein [Mechercharimyces sp. CAU 1602]
MNSNVLCPLVFIPSEGKRRDEVYHFWADGDGCRFYFFRDRVEFCFSTDEETATLSLHFVNVQPQAGMEISSTEHQVIYKEVWEGIDLIFSGNQEQLKYDIIVHPGACVEHICLRYEGGEEVSLSEEGDLFVHMQNGVLREGKPVSFQWMKNGRVSIPTHFQLNKDDSIGFAIANEMYDPTMLLVIDPVVFYSTYLGGTEADIGNGITVDSSRSAYVTGVTDSADFPTTTGAFQTINMGGGDVFVSKLNVAGSSLVYSTLVGGTGGDIGRSIAVDATGNTYVTGQTSSTNYPVTSGAFQTVASVLADAFVTKLNATGTSLLYSTYLGGSGDDDDGFGIDVDDTNNAYVAGETNSTDFPITTGAFQTVNAGTGIDAFITKLNPAGTALVYSTFLGGTDNDRGRGIVINESNQAYVTGLTDSTNFPTTTGAFQTVFGGGGDAFITKLNTTGSALVYSTYLGGSNTDAGNAIDLDGGNNAYVTGRTFSTDFPTTNNAFQTIFSASTASDAFVTKLNPIGSALIYSTFLGGLGDDIGFGIGVDSFGGAWVTGQTNSTNFPVTSDAFQDSLAGLIDAFVTQISFSGQGISFSSYLGGSFEDEGNGVAVGPLEAAYLTGQTASFNFPVTSGAIQTMNPSPEVDSAFVTKVGPLSSVGATGPTGPTGATGVTGAAGAQGARGPRGRRGPRGPRGPRGMGGEGEFGG